MCASGQHKLGPSSIDHALPRTAPSGKRTITANERNNEMGSETQRDIKR